MKRILYIIPTLKPGGAEKAAILVANYLVMHYSYDITFFVYDDSMYYRSLIDDRIHIIQIGEINTFVNKLFYWYYYYIDIGLKLFNSINITEYDYVIAVHEQVPEVSVFWLWFLHLIRGKNIRKKLVSIIQISLFGLSHEKTHISSRLLLSILKFIRRYVFQSIVVLSKREYNNLESSHNNISIIPNPIDSKIMLKKNEDTNVLHHPYILFVARIVEQKNPMLLLKSFEQIYQRVNFNVIMIGHTVNSILYKKIVQFIYEKKLEKRISILGSVDDPYDYMVNAKAVLLSSNYEGLPLSLLEAMALHVPIITTKYDGYEEYFNNQNAILVERNSEEDLARALLLIESNKPNVQKRVTQAYDDCKKYNIDIIGEKYHQLFSGKTG